ncbi:MAG: dipeptide epimerase [Bacteroidales bacterium]|jgi:L-alanine-DL-glutamate epimerase-like enolase superfamily enzyme|nr:dipeptide epimerase [Bacteroidales bacterium]
MAGRREFIKQAGIISVAAGLAGYGCSNRKNNATGKSAKGMILTFKPYEVELKHVFTIAGSSRRTTPVMLTEIEFDGITGYGEASMPPYLGESHETVSAFLQKVDLSGFNDPFLMEDILDYVDGIAPGNYAAKASVDIALHDLVGKIVNQPWYRIWGLNPDKTPGTSFTIGIDTPDVVRQKVHEAAEFNILKVKLGQDNDREMIETIRSVTDVPLCVDVNQGWKEKTAALDMIHWLAERNVVFVEQPLPANLIDDNAWLTGESPLPVIADESVQTAADIKSAYGVYSGINIKLMKCGGMRAALKMINTARSLGMKVMMGCMTETSCAISAATQLSPLIDWADLDGNLLISNDVFDGVKVNRGKLVLNSRPGIGVQKL